MEIQQWRRLALQSTAFLVLVLVCCLGLSQREQRQIASAVRAGEKKEAGNGKAIPLQEKKEAPTAATRSLVEERSDTYIRISREHLAGVSDVYLQNKYMKFQVVLTFQGIPAGSVSAGDILRVQGYHVAGGKVSKKDRLVRKMQILDQKRTERRENTVQVVLELKKAYEPILFVSEDAYYISLLSARKAHKKIVVVDAGHGGMDEGTSSVNRKHHEKDYVLSIQQKLSVLLAKKGVKVYYTRTRDENVSKRARTRLANALQADLFVSIHCNALQGGKDTYGVETLYSAHKPKYGKMSNRELAQILLDRVAESTGRKKRGSIRREGLYLLHHSQVPATIVEVGYMTNREDMEFMEKEIGQQKIAEGICQGIMSGLDDH